MLRHFIFVLSGRSTDLLRLFTTFTLSPGTSFTIPASHFTGRRYLIYFSARFYRGSRARWRVGRMSRCRRSLRVCTTINSLCDARIGSLSAFVSPNVVATSAALVQFHGHISPLLVAARWRQFCLSIRKAFYSTSSPVQIFKQGLIRGTRLRRLVINSRQHEIYVARIFIFRQRFGK
jgi:hypothetical protein